MSALQTAEQSVRDGDPVAALKYLQDEVKAKPADAKLRVFLFQLLSVLGQWERALNQLNVAATLDPAALAMAQTYREALRCESLRAQVFEGKKSPMIFGEPEQWLALLVESMLLSGRGRGAEAGELRTRAFDEAEASSGAVDGKPFTWIADADSRLGPVLEAIIEGKYYWVPICRIQKLEMPKPSDMRDLIWLPSQFTWTNGGAVPGHIPARYPGTEESTDDQLRLVRQTQWRQEPGETYLGLGQRVLTTDANEYPLLECRTIEFEPSKG